LALCDFHEVTPSGRPSGLIVPSPGLAIFDSRRAVPVDVATLPGGKVPPLMLGLPEVLGLLEGFDAFTFMLFLGDPRNVPVPGTLL